MNNPLVSISCITFNHEEYIRQCLDGFIMQQTSFRFEVLIHDDASTDNTARIIKEYEKTYPEIIIPIYQTENQFSKGIGSINANFNYPRARGKYIAMCEGDDYWIDPMKLQKQVDFLEANHDYGLTHGDSNFYFVEKQKWEYHLNRNLSNQLEVSDKKDLFYRLLDGNYKIRTATVLFRKELLTNRLPNTRIFLMGDTPMWLDFSQMTKFKYFDEVFAVYGVLPESASRSSDKLKTLKFGMSMAEMRIYYCKKYTYAINENLEKRYNTALLNLKTFDPDFCAQYPLLNPSKYEKIKLNLLSISVFRYFYKIEMFLKKYKNVVWNKTFGK